MMPCPKSPAKRKPEVNLQVKDIRILMGPILRVELWGRKFLSSRAGKLGRGSHNFKNKVNVQFFSLNAVKTKVR